MSDLADLAGKIQYVVDEEGNRTAVLVNLVVWEEIVELLEDLEDTREMLRAKGEPDEEISWEQVKADYWASHPDADV